MGGTQTDELTLPKMFVGSGRIGEQKKVPSVATLEVAAINYDAPIPNRKGLTIGV